MTTLPTFLTTQITNFKTARAFLLEPGASTPELTALLEAATGKAHFSVAVRELAVKADRRRLELLAFVEEQMRLASSKPATDASTKKKDNRSRPGRVRTNYPTDPAVDGAGKCLCGCGTDSRGRFLPGHDARLRGKAIAVSVNRLPAHTISTSAAAFIITWDHVTPEVQSFFRRLLETRTGSVKAAA